MYKILEYLKDYIVISTLKNFNFMFLYRYKS